MKTQGFAASWMLAVAGIVIGGAALTASAQDKEKSLYGAGEGTYAAKEKPKMGFLGTAPYRSAFAVKEDAGMVIWKGATGYFHQNKLSYKGPLVLNTPFGLNKRGTEYKNDDADPMSPYSPQTFWISNERINGPYYVIASKNKDGQWAGFTENADGGPLADK